MVDRLRPPHMRRGQEADGLRIGKVTCPCCIRGVTTLGTHEMLRGHDRVHQPGEYIDYIENVIIHQGN